jgi:hypothetical protein
MCSRVGLYRVHSLRFCAEHALKAKLIPSENKVRYYKRLRLNLGKRQVDSNKKRG